MHAHPKALSGLLPLLLLLLLSPTTAFLAPEHFLQRTFTLYSGRTTGCPYTISFGQVGSDLTVPASSISADGVRCTGPGGKVLRSGEFVRASGLSLPTLLTGPHTRFFAGVESATRVCGGWAFNASAISWFVASSRLFRDAASGVLVHPQFLQLTYLHMAHLCVYRAALSAQERAEIARRSIVLRAVHPDKDHGPRPQRHCFPASAVVSTPAGPRRVADLRVGDTVLARPGVYSKVYMFSHRDAAAMARFVRVVAHSGDAVVLTHGHLLYVNGRLAPAGDVRPGDEIVLASGARASVKSVRVVSDTGLYAPHTVLGDVVVDGVVVSSFTTAVRPTAAHALLSPLRASAPLLVRYGSLRAIVERAVDALRATPALPDALSGAW